jgi:cbb3-type cytochrome oxidase subunit 3
MEYSQAIATGLLVLGVLYWAYRKQRGRKQATTRNGTGVDQPPSDTRVDQ